MNEATSATLALAELDHRILALLQEDAAVSNVGLSTRVGASSNVRKVRTYFCLARTKFDTRIAR
jgi:hypothetical protein